MVAELFAQPEFVDGQIGDRDGIPGQIRKTLQICFGQDSPPGLPFVTLLGLNSGEAIFLSWFVEPRAGRIRSQKLVESAIIGRKLRHQCIIAGREAVGKRRNRGSATQR